MKRFVEIKNLEKTYYGRGILKRGKNAVKAVDRVSLGIEKKSVFGLVGESGCGKTSLVRSVLYLDPPTAGEVWVDNTLLGDLSRRGLRTFRRRMQIVFQDPNSALNPKMNIQDSLEEGLVNRGIDAVQRKKQTTRMLDLVGISPSHSARYPHEFSGGQKQRIVIARALCMEPDFLVLDEPVSNLDVSIQAQIINLLQDLKSELELTYLFISHDLNLVAYLSDRIAVMYKGRLVESGSTDEIMGRPLHPYTLRLFSSIPGMQADTAPEGLPPQAEPVAASHKKTTLGTGGCNYVDFCPMGDGDCTLREPRRETIAGSHKVACFKIGNND
ncbi:MAG: ATP-binding cassette domain-containing protein [Deltaproteobacteria bacterium]|nr:ATP-binding cassette domain-containing protein [Deltaproteobacteria bacterium]